MAKLLSREKDWKQWPKKLAAIETVHRTMPARPSGLLPAEVCFGFRPRTPWDAPGDGFGKMAADTDVVRRWHNTRAAFRALHDDDAECFLQEGAVDSAQALELGLASERVEGAGERALQFAHWLVQHSAVGVRHMLQLTCRPEVDEMARGVRCSNETLLREALDVAG